MNLGDLEFKPEDFSFDNCYGDAKRMIEEACAKQANHLLRERLAKATELFRDARTNGVWVPYKRDETHHARLVCIEEIEK